MPVEPPLEPRGTAYAVRMSQLRNLPTPRTRGRWFILAAFLVAIGLAHDAVAQEARGAIQGRVVDSSGAAVPGATVEVTNLATGVVPPTVTNDEGSYSGPVSDPRSYTVTVALDGFSRFVSNRIEVHVADLLTVDASLQVGALTDEVSVTAVAATIDRSTAELGQVVDARRIAELPIREGSPVELVILAPGVTVTTDLRSRKAAFNNGLSQFSTDGVGEKKNDFTIDGVSNVANDRVAYSPPSASVEEFKIHTTSYDAAIGNTMGAVVNLVTKSGTNVLRGEAYEWFRGASLDARNYFDKRAGRSCRVRASRGWRRRRRRCAAAMVSSTTCSARTGSPSTRLAIRATRRSRRHSTTGRRSSRRWSTRSPPACSSPSARRSA